MTSIQTDLPATDKPESRATPAPCTLMITPETPSALTRAFAGLTAELRTLAGRAIEEALDAHPTLDDMSALRTTLRNVLEYRLEEDFCRTLIRTLGGEAAFASRLLTLARDAGLCEADDEEKLSGRLFLADVALAAEDSERITAAIAGRLSTETLYADLSHEIRHAMEAMKTDLTASIRESLAALAATGGQPVAAPGVVIEGPACEEVAGEHTPEMSRGDIELELSLANLEAAIGDIEMLVEPDIPAPLPETAPLSEPVGDPHEAPSQRSRVRGFIDSLRRAGERFFSKEAI